MGITDTLIVELYNELRTIARREHARAGGPQTMPATALVNAAYVRLKDKKEWESRAHFLGCAATAMRHLLIDAARARRSAKRGAGFEFTQCIDSLSSASPDDELSALGDALKELAEVDINMAKVVDCRFFAGMSEEETAEVLGVSDRTVRRWWVQARAWIHREMGAAR
jgi:RNA polymerase sigma factor (TIGR02999 family)